VISSVLDLQEERTIGIMGEVREPGTFPYARNITLGEMIRTAGGLTDAASLSRVEVARRVVNKNADRPGEQVSRYIHFHSMPCYPWRTKLLHLFSNPSIWFL
jgi:protein involved in polysaccharide export with SLBB domain